MPERDFQDISVAQILPTVDNPRHVRKTDPGIAELAASIAKHGVLEPLLVRRHPKHKGKFELRAGERRLTAAKVAGCKTVPCILEEMDEERAGVVTVLENLQRENLAPVEVARGLKTLQVKAGMDAKAIAEATGKHFSWVYRRLSLTNLSETWLAALEKREFAFMGAKHLECVARFDEHVQDMLLKRLTDARNWLVRNRATVPEFEEFTNQAARVLQNALWKVDDAQLVAAAGPCSECAKRSSCRPELFPGSKEDLCLDPACWDHKSEAWMKQREAQLRETHGDKLKLAKLEYTGREAPPGALNYHEVDTCKKHDKGAFPALIVDGKSKGKLRWLKKASRTDSDATQKPKMDFAAKQAQRRRKQIRGLKERLHKPLMALTFEDSGLGVEELLRLLVGLKFSRGYGGGQKWREQAKQEADTPDLLQADPASLTVVQLQERMKRAARLEREDPAGRTELLKRLDRQKP